MYLIVFTVTACTIYTFLFYEMRCETHQIYDMKSNCSPSRRWYVLYNVSRPPGIAPPFRLSPEAFFCAALVFSVSE